MDILLDIHVLIKLLLSGYQLIKIDVLWDNHEAVSRDYHVATLQN